MRSVVVFVSGPLESGPHRPEQNVRAACLIAEDLRRIGREHGVHVVAIIPHLSMACDVITPRPRADWLADDLVLVSLAAVVFRFGGASDGAEMETARAVELGIPVLRSPGQFGDWLRSRKDREASQPSVHSLPERVELGVAPRTPVAG